MATRTAQRLGMLREAARVSLDSIEDAVGENDPVALDRRKPPHRDPDAAEIGALELEDLPAVDVVLRAEALQLGEQRLRVFAVRGHGLQAELRVARALLVALEKQHEVGPAIPDQPQSRCHARDLPLADLDDLE